MNAKFFIQGLHALSSLDKLVQVLTKLGDEILFTLLGIIKDFKQDRVKNGGSRCGRQIPLPNTPALHLGLTHSPLVGEYVNGKTNMEGGLASLADELVHKHIAKA